MTLLNYFKIPNEKYGVKIILKWLWKAWRGNRLQAFLNALLGILGVCTSLGQVWAIHRAIDIASHQIEGSIFMAVGVMGLLILANFVLSIAGVWVSNILGIKAQNRMQQQQLDRLLRSRWEGKEGRHSGDVINRLGSDVGKVVSFLTEVIPSTLSTLVLFIGAFGYLFAMDHRLALLTVGILPVFLLLSKLYVGKMRVLTRKVRDYDSKVQSILQETVQHRMLIKTLEGNEQVVERLGDTQTELRRRVVKRTVFSVASYFILNFGFSFGYLVAFLWTSLRLMDHTLTYGGMSAFLQLVYRIQSPARSLASLVPTFVGVFTAAERLMELEENPLEEEGDPIPFDTPCGLRLADVSFRYTEQEELVLNKLSFDFRPGTCTAILGETGAGKTTIIRMLLALITPTEGSVTLYDTHKEAPLSPRMRCNFVYVPQGNTLMSGTIRDNLRLGKFEATEEEMKAALKQSCADFVFDLPDGLDTYCSESGGGLSEGQAQRIAIARALLRNGSIMLFDESTSALDPETERTLLTNILSESHKTIIFITHRPAVVDYCDATLRLE